MMQEKAFGSLSGNLLARKGGARPAMRPQAYRFGADDASAEDDDCGWNDMGTDMLTPEQRDSLLPIGNVTSIVGASARLADEAAGQDTHWPAREQQRALNDEVTAFAGNEQAAQAHDIAASLDTEDRSAHDAYLARLQAEFSEDGPLEEEGHERAAPAAAAPEPVSQPKARIAPGMKARSAFTLRLDKQRHLKLRLACAFAHISAQRLLTDALDEYLDRHHPDLPA